MQEVMKKLRNAGYKCGLAVATKAEVEAGAACGQLATIVEAEAKDGTGQL